MVIAAVAMQCRGELDEPLQLKRRKLDKSLNNETRLWLDLHAAYVDEVQEAVGQVRHTYVS